MMKMFARALAIAAAVAVAPPASAAEIRLLATTAMNDALDTLLPSFERQTSHKVVVSYGPSGGVARRFRRGEPADLVVIAAPELEALIKEGRILPGPTVINRTGIGIAVRKGAPKPDVSTPDALKRTLLAAKSVGHTAPAGGGITAMHLLRMFEKLGVAQEVAAKTKLAAGGPNGRVSTLIVNGEAEIAFQQVSELMSNPEVEVIGLLPDELQQITTHMAGTAVSAKEPEAGKALVRHLTAPEAMALYKTKGLGL